MDQHNYDDPKAKIESDDGPIEVKRVSLEMNITDFLALFKRFEVALSRDALFDDYEYSYL